MFNIWNINAVSGTSLGTIPERQMVDLTLPADISPGNITFELISGNLPNGLRLNQNKIVGTTFEVAVVTTSSFVLRAQFLKTITAFTNGNAYIENHGFNNDNIDGTSIKFYTSDTAFNSLNSNYTYYLRWQTENELSFHPTQSDAQANTNKINLSYTLKAGNFYYISKIVDRTYKMTVEGPDDPLWITPEGALRLGGSGLRTSNISSISRFDNVVTIGTEYPHKFIRGNTIVVNSEIIELNSSAAQVLSTTSTTLSYARDGADFTTISTTGTVKLLKEPLAFVLDNTYVEFQLSAIDTDLPAGDRLEFFIEDGNGELPLGLSLSNDGIISGKIDPILALDISAGTGYFDTNLFDSNAYDFGVAPQNGMDSFLYDSYVYDYYSTVRQPRKLNRNYEFIVSVSDGTSIIPRKFRIFVVGDDFLRSDNTIMQAGSGTFTADNTFLRAAVWLSASNLGIKRANNYVTVFLDAFDANPELGPLVYQLETVNDDLSTSELPPGLFIDSTNGELFGYIPYQPAVTREYKFTVTAIKYDAGSYTEVEVQVVVLARAPYGQTFLEISPLPAEDVNLLLNETIRIGTAFYRVSGYTTVNETTSILNLTQNLLLDVPAGSVFTKTFYQSTVEFNTTRTSKTFKITVLGEVESVINWTTPFDLGTVKANFRSILYVRAQTSVLDAVLTYRLVGGQLPPGLSLSTSGDIVGQVRQYGTVNDPGLTTFDNQITIFDGGTTTYDRVYTFSILAEDQFKYSGILGTFTVKVETPDNKLYSNLFVKPLQKAEKRSVFYGFITNNSIFTPSKIYRPSDTEFGVQTELKMLLYAGLETTDANFYAAALTNNAKRKRFIIGQPKLAIAKKMGSAAIEYEVVYLEIFDEYEIGTTSISSKIKLPTKINSQVLVNQARINAAEGDLSTTESQERLSQEAIARFRPLNTPISADATSVNISGQDLEYVYPASVTNIRNNLKNIQLTNLEPNRQIASENEFLPLWMLTPQDNRTAATGFIKAVPLCYCKAGEGTYILENILNSGFDFTQIDYEIDRCIIDITTENRNEFLSFNNYKFNV